MEKRSSGISGHETLVIVLSTVLGTIGIVAIGFGGFWYLRNRRRHRLFDRGLTPIGDEEIETWKVSREEDKETEAYASSSRSSPPRTHATKDSTSTARIQYQKGGPAFGRPSTSHEMATAPRSFISMDLPRAPEAAVFARAPNARTGLTDETVPGDDPFVPLKRQPSRLQKMQPSRASSNRSRSSRTRTARSQTNPEKWHRSADSSPVGPRTGSGHSRIYSSSFIPPPIRQTATITSSDDKETFVGLSPPPSRHREIIGQALG